MLKKLFKSTLIAMMAVGVAGTASAEETPIITSFGLKPVAVQNSVAVNARYGQYFGQYDTGVEGSSAHFKNFGEAGVQLSGGVGAASFFIDLETRTGVQEFEFYDAIARASYKTPVGMLSIGKVTNYIGQVATNPGGGIKSGSGGFGATMISTLAGATESDGIDLLIPLMDKSLVFEFTVWDRAAVARRTWSMDREGLNQSTEGSTTAVGVMYRNDTLMVKAGTTSETMDDYSIDTDTADTSTYSMLSAKLDLGFMEIDASMTNTVMAGIDKTRMSDLLAGNAVFMDNPSTFTSSAIGFGLKFKQLGPGDLNINYESGTMEDTHEATGAVAAALDMADASFSQVKTSLIYTIRISEKIGYQLLYDTKAQTPEGGDTTTASYIAGGLFGYF